MRKNKIIMGSLIISALLVSGCKKDKDKHLEENKPTPPAYTEAKDGKIVLGNDIVIEGASSGLGASAKVADNTKLTGIENNVSEAKEIQFVNLKSSIELELVMKLDEVNKNILTSVDTDQIETYVIGQYLGKQWKEIGYFYPSTASEFRAKIKLDQNTASSMIVAIRKKAEPLAVRSGKDPYKGHSEAGTLAALALQNKLGVDIVLYPSGAVQKGVSTQFQWNMKDTSTFIDSLYSYTSNKMVKGKIKGSDLATFLQGENSKYANIGYQSGSFEYNIHYNADGTLKEASYRLNGKALEMDREYTIAFDSYRYSNYGEIAGLASITEGTKTQKELIGEYITGLNVFPDLDQYQSSVLKEVIDRPGDISLINGDSYTEYTNGGILMSEALRAEASLDLMLFPSGSVKKGVEVTYNPAMTEGELTSLIDSLFSNYISSNKVVKGTIKGSDLKNFIVDISDYKFRVDLQGGSFEYDLLFNADKSLKTSTFTLDNIAIDDNKVYTIGVDSYAIRNYRSYNNFDAIFTELETLGTERDLLLSYLMKKPTLPNFDAFDASIVKESGSIVDGKKIYEIQGDSFNSPLANQIVTGITGIVTAVDVSGTNGSSGIRGFFLQDQTGDNNDKTSDGIFVKYTTTGSEKDKVKVGDIVSLDGTVEEAMSEANKLSQTQIIDIANLKVISSGNELPAPIVLGVDRRIPQDAISTYNGDLNTKSSLNLADGIDFYESIEGMLVAIDNPIVTGTKHKYKDIYVMAPGNYDVGLSTDMGGLVIEEGDFNPEIVHIKGDTIFGDTSYTTFSNPKTTSTGDVFNGRVEGVMKYDTSTYGGYFLINTKPLPDFQAKNKAKEVTTLTGDVNGLTIASYNVENLYSTDAKMADIAQSIITNLNKPDIVGLIEIQDHDGVNDGAKTGTEAGPTLDALVAAIKAIDSSLDYEWINIDPEEGKDGGAPGGNIRVAYIYNPARVGFTKVEGATANTAASFAQGKLNFNPVRINPEHEAFASSRKSLAAQFEFKGETITIINNHFNSKRGDSSLWGGTQPVVLGSEVQRNQMATEVNKFIKELVAGGEKVVALGDFNEFYFGEPIRLLKGTEMINLIDGLDVNKRYTYNFQGNSQTLDHILISNGIGSSNAEVDIVHMNAGFLDQISDHDPIVAKIIFN